MIELFKADNTDYSNNGDYTLEPVSAKLTMELNGAWSLDFEVPQTDEVLEHLQHDSVIAIRLPRWGRQLYVVSNPKRANFDTVSAAATPIAMWDAQNELICMDYRPTNQTGAGALSGLLAACGGTEKYRVRSDIRTTATAYWIRKNFMECLAGDEDNSFLRRWGGEIIYDNFSFIVDEAAGDNTGLVLSASKNIAGFTVSEDDSNFADVLIPIGYNGRTKGTMVKRSDIGRIEHRRFVDYSNVKLEEDAGTTSDGDIICKDMDELDAQLVALARDDYRDGLYLPTFTYDIDYVDLRNSKEYAQISDLASLWLGDRVSVDNLDRHITTKQKVVALTYDVVSDTIESVTLGTAARDFFGEISSAASSANDRLDGITDKNGSVLADKVAGVLNAMNTQLKYQKNVSQKQDVRAILFEDVDPDSPTFGALCIGTQGIQISKKRNAANSDWEWGTAIDYRTIYADMIIAGTLTGKSGNFFFDLDTGKFELGSGLFKGTINTTEDTKVGGRLYLDYDSSGDVLSSISLGDKGNYKTSPALTMYGTENSWDIRLSSVIGRNKKSYISVGSNISSNGSDSGSISINGINNVFVESGDYIYLKSKAISISDGNKYYTGLNYEGKVKSIKTVNGLVVKASAS